MDAPLSSEVTGKRSLSESEDVYDDPTTAKPNADLETPKKRKKSVTSELPDVFEMDELTHDQRLAAYLTIFQHCAPSVVLAALSECMRENVASTGWTAVWKPHGFDRHVLVQVEEAPVVDGFHAQVGLDKNPLGVEKTSDPTLPTMQSDIETFLKIHDHVVPMAELCPVYDESGYLDDTALALEHLRFFMEYLWRFSDEEEDGSYSFLERTLIPRLKFYYEMKNEVLPDNLVEVYTATFKAYEEKHRLLTDMQSQLADSDSEIEDLNESRIAMSIMEVHEELTALETKLERMENPTLRQMVMYSIDRESSSPKSMLVKKILSRASESSSNEAVTHLVGGRITVGMVQDLQLPRETVVQSHMTIGDAVSAASDGDIILLFPGTHSAEGLENFPFSLTFMGLGNPNETVISCQGLTDPLELAGSEASFRNVKFYDEPSNWLLSSSNSKSFEAVRCIFEGGGVQLYGNGEMKLQECEIFGALSYGVCILSGSEVALEDCNIHHNGSSAGEEDCGVLIEIDTREHMESTRVEMTRNRIHDNQGPGLLVVDSEEGPKTYREGRLEDLDSIQNFKGTLEGNLFTANLGGDYRCSFKVLGENGDQERGVVEGAGVEESPS